MQKIDINVFTEIGKLNGVVIHRPGPEVENMTPENAQRALYSDILNLSVALPEYDNFAGVLKKYTNVFEVSDLLYDVIKNHEYRDDLLQKICKNERVNEEDLCGFIENIDEKNLSKQLIQGIEMRKDNLTRFLDNEHYSLHPLPNFFFTRDASFSIGNEVMIGKMANGVRDREKLIMETIFNHHPMFKSKRSIR